jgi:hypothetical protein
MRIVVCGGRSFRDYAFLKRKLCALTRNLKRVVILHGNARGADLLAERWQQEMWRRENNEFNHLKHQTIERHRPDFTKHGSPAALFVRNEEMARDCDCVVAFWDGKSGGTKDMIARGRKHHRIVKVFHY